MDFASVGVLECIPLHVIENEIVQTRRPGLILFPHSLAAGIEMRSEEYVEKSQTGLFGLEASKTKTESDADVYLIESMLCMQ